MLANLVISLALVKALGFLATAMGTTISSWMMLCLLIYFAKRYELNLDRHKTLTKEISMIVFCSALMGLFLNYADFYLFNTFGNGLAKYLAFVLLIGGAACIYIICLYLLGFQKYVRHFSKKGLKPNEK